MSSPMPKGWVEHRQGDIVEISNGRAYKLTEWEKQGTPVIRLQNLTGSGKDYYYSNLKLPEHQYCNFGDLLYMWSATFGAHIWSGQKAIYHYHIWKITCDEINITKHYLYQLLGQKTAEWMNQSNGMGILHVTKRSMEEMALTLPPLQEQQKIASILTAVDDVIESTQAQINKLKDLKTGMMQELLTKGIGHTEFKDSPVGQIPKAWEVMTVEDVAFEIVVGIVVQPTQYYVHSGVPALRSANVREIGLNGDNLKYITRESNEKLKKSQLYEGNLVTVRTGYPGTTAVVEKKFDGANCIDIIITRPRDSIDSNFLCTWVNSDIGKGQVLKAQGGLAQQHFNVGDMKRMLVAIPPLDEQRKISQVLKSVTLKLEIVNKKLDRLLNQKKALMQDLLTGKVRVNVA
ncbi:restriction endonuclease subunit S [Undibacterium sp. Ji49W]|uniref:restriction endonuclease subunit S n=1 Tax=Undibacterium sp. Ji49W TaxID=3413040 RepID=UPI003BF130D1